MPRIYRGKKRSPGQKVRRHQAQEQYQDPDEHFGQELKQPRNLLLKACNAEDAEPDQNEAEPRQPKDGAAEQHRHRREMCAPKNAGSPRLLRNSIEFRKAQNSSQSVLE